jgi:hypothetical protein
MVIGLAALPAGILAGILYDTAPIWTFFYGAIIALVSLILLTIFLRKNEDLKTY